ncbi:MAG: GIY-YIG nuclease family protein [Williamsia sp.]|nr:GIY-YIG nuclease family protein [Williamsia sp.]
MNKQKELKEQYKAQKMKIGVFQIRNTANGKVYVESSNNLDASWNRNRTELNFGNHRNETLQKEWKEFGEEKFKFEILAEIAQKDNEKVDYGKEAKQLARMFIEELQPFDEQGYNSRKM